MAYKIVLTRSAVKELGGLSSKVHDNVVKHLRKLENQPRGAGIEKLSGIEAYKLRIGNHRVIYEIDDRKKEVRIVMIDDRKQVYRRLRKR
jgi:mRNA interferase RelE/StbE